MATKYIGAPAETLRRWPWGRLGFPLLVAHPSRLIWLRVSQSDRLGEGSLEAIEGLLQLMRPRTANILLGQCRKWFRDAGKTLDKLRIIAYEASPKKARTSRTHFGTG